jgi:hypothetical protein
MAKNCYFLYIDTNIDVEGDSLLAEMGGFRDMGFVERNGWLLGDGWL